MRIVVLCEVKKVLSSACQDKGGRETTDLARRIDRQRVNLNVKDDKAAAFRSDGMIARYSNLSHQEGRELKRSKEKRRKTSYISYEAAARPLRPVLYTHTASLHTIESTKVGQLSKLGATHRRALRCSSRGD